VKKRQLEGKVKTALRLMFFRSRSKPGISGNELKKLVGSDLSQVLIELDKRLEPLGLKVKGVLEDGRKVDLTSNENLEKAWFGIVLREKLGVNEIRTSGWRIDDLAVLTISILYILSMRGKAPRKNIVDLLKDKIPEWRIKYCLEKFRRMGYFVEENGVLRLGWRTFMEVDLEQLARMSGK